jgi:DNA-binding MarR family transcriptional regulator
MRLEDEIKQRVFKDDYQKAYISLIYTNYKLESLYKAFFLKFDITPQQYNILRILRGAKEKSVNLYYIKERMLDKTCDASRIVERLRLKKLINRTQNEVDRRHVDIYITKSGLEVLEEIDKAIQPLNDIMKVLDLTETRQLIHILDKIREAVDTFNSRNNLTYLDKNS